MIFWKKNNKEIYNDYVNDTNQITLAYQNHLRIIEKLWKPHGTVLEIGCGRSTISQLLIKEGCECIGIDMEYRALKNRDLDLLCGDCMELPFVNDSFDCIISMGLLEHFYGTFLYYKTLVEAKRVLKGNGVFIAYIVPRKKSIQNLFYRNHQKDGIFRNNLLFDVYNLIFGFNSFKNIEGYYVYPIPFLSYSPNFPATLNPKPIEVLLTYIMKMVLSVRRKIKKGKDEWIGSERWCQGLIIKGEK